jgi:predicted RNA-binding protein with PUA-like domain
MAKAHFLIKSEPSVYAFDRLVRDGKTRWDGVRNFEARNNLRAMKLGELCLYYHSNEGKEIVGVARVAREGYKDPTSDEDWTAVDVEPVEALARPVTLGEMRAHPLLSKMMLFRRSRLSVVPVTDAEYAAVIALSKTAAAAPPAKKAAAKKAPAKKATPPRRRAPATPERAAGGRKRAP